MPPDDTPILIVLMVFWAIVFGFYFAWQRRRYLAGKQAWFPALLFYPLMYLTGYRPERAKGAHLFDNLIIHADAPTPMAYRAWLRNGKRIAAFLALADELLARSKSGNNGGPVGRIGTSRKPGVTGIGGEG